MESPYKIKHWSPVKRVPKSVDCWGNAAEWEDVHADEYPMNKTTNLNDVLEIFKHEESHDGITVLPTC